MGISIDPITTLFVLIAILWVPILLIIGWAGGWSELTKQFRFRGPAPASRRFLISGSVGPFRYRNSLVVAVCDEGLYLAQFFVFRPGHPPVVIPWDALQVVEQSTDDHEHTDVKLATTNGVYIRLPARLFNDIIAQLPHIASMTHFPDMARRIKIIMMMIPVVGIVWLIVVLHIIVLQL